MSCALPVTKLVKSPRDINGANSVLCIISGCINQWSLLEQLKKKACQLLRQTMVDVNLLWFRYLSVPYLALVHTIVLESQF